MHKFEVMILVYPSHANIHRQVMGGGIEEDTALGGIEREPRFKRRNHGMGLGRPGAFPG